MIGIYSTEDWNAGGQRLYEDYVRIVHEDHMTFPTWDRLTVDERIKFKLLWLSTVMPSLLVIQKMKIVALKHGDTCGRIIDELREKGIDPHD